MAKKSSRPPVALPLEKTHQPEGGKGNPPPERRTGRTLYDTIVDDFLPLLIRPRTGIPILIFVVSVAIILFMFRSQGISYETGWFGVRLGGAQAETQSANLRKCLAEARRLNKPYAIESATYLIQVEKDFINKQDVLRHSRRIFYTLRALQPIKSDQDLFIEEIDTHIPNAVFEHWYGNEKEVFHDPNNRQKFNVFFDMEKDDVRTVITGANFILPLPFTPRTALENHLTLLPNQDFEAYPNSSDAICELNILVESKSLPIQPIGDAAKRFFEANLKNEEAKLTFDQGLAGGARTISARWRNVMIGETVGIYFSFQ